MTKRRQVIIGTRGSQLALTQAGAVCWKLQTIYPEIDFIIKKIKTTGDKLKTAILPDFDTRGLFTKEIEQALLKNSCDLAVHSAKDLPTEMPAGLKIGAVTTREDPHDVLVSKKGCKLKDLPRGAKIGTSSLRRQAQLLAYRPDLKIRPLRGNINTRMDKLKSNDLEAIIVAAAGLNRLGLEKSITQIIPYSVILPAVGQGAVCIQIRADDKWLYNKIAKLNHKPTQQSIIAERRFLKELRGGCQVPVGIVSSVQGQVLTMKAVVLSLDGRNIIKGRIKGVITSPLKTGNKLARQLILKGADRILAQIR